MNIRAVGSVGFYHDRREPQAGPNDTARTRVFKPLQHNDDDTGFHVRSMDLLAGEGGESPATTNSWLSS
jgi:hypothetical protein